MPTGYKKLSLHFTFVVTLTVSNTAYDNNNFTCSKQVPFQKNNTTKYCYSIPYTLQQHSTLG